MKQNKTKKKHSLLNYFNIKEVQRKENKIFELVLVDIKQPWHSSNIKCIKMNMYDPDLEYIAISYRWGELNEQLVVTPDYTAHITSFKLNDLVHLCAHINNEPDLKQIPYLWLDAISVDQQNKERKKETILKMNQIYKNATYILAVPDLHMEYLMKNTANKEKLELIDRYKYSIYVELFNIKHSSTISITEDMNSSVIDSDISQPTKNNYYSFILNRNMINKVEERKLEKNENELKQERDELKKLYQFLAYLIDDWSNRAWVISEYHIAKEKYKKYKTPLKYWFISLNIYNSPFFSYYFVDDDQKCVINNENNNNNNNSKLIYTDVAGYRSFHRFLNRIFMQRSHLDMILNSNATRNEDRFNAILPSWIEYKHFIKNKDTVSKWDITNMTSVRLKVYEMMNHSDLWEKAKLLNACSIKRKIKPIILPSFASFFNMEKLIIIEKYNHNDVTYKAFEMMVLKRLRRNINREKVVQIKKLIHECKTNSKPIWTENLISILFKRQNCCLFVKSKTHFIKVIDEDDKGYWRSFLFLDNHDEIHDVFIPFFTFTMPNIPYIYVLGSQIHLVGNIDKNRWVLANGNPFCYKSEHFCSDSYSFNIF
ncbi:unnamed protein product [Cunninghamella blakesleeana]